MRIFILSTGRCGSTAIEKACQHIENYTSGHESLVRYFGENRFHYKDNHIESDNRLCWHLGQLQKLYGDTAFYVHLRRDRDKVAKSFMQRYFLGSIVDSFCGAIKKSPPELMTKEERLQACYDYVDTVNDNIEHFMSDKKSKMVINLENITDDFTELWHRINAKGNLKSALNEFKIKHNPSAKRKLHLRYRMKLFILREWQNLLMWLDS